MINLAMMTMMKRILLIWAVAAALMSAMPASAETEQGRLMDTIADEIGRQLTLYVQDLSDEASAKFSGFMSDLGLGADDAKGLSDRLGAIFSAAMDEMKREAEKAVADSLREAAGDLRGQGGWRGALGALLDSAAHSIESDPQETASQEEQRSDEPQRKTSHSTIKPDKLIPQTEQ